MAWLLLLPTCSASPWNRKPGKENALGQAKELELVEPTSCFNEQRNNSQLSEARAAAVTVVGIGQGTVCCSCFVLCTSGRFCPLCASCSVLRRSTLHAPWLGARSTWMGGRLCLCGCEGVCASSGSAAEQRTEACCEWVVVKRKKREKERVSRVCDVNYSLFACFSLTHAHTHTP